MTVKEIASKVFDNDLKGESEPNLIGFYEEDEKGNVKHIYPDFADEIVETHGDMLVKDYKYVESKNVLVIELDKE